MAIAIDNPRSVAVSLRCNKKRAAYQVDKKLTSFLKARNWTLQNVGRSYATVTPPNGMKAPFVFNVKVPSREQIVAVAQEKHSTKAPWADKFGEWIALYIPSRNMTSTEIDPYTGQAISEPKPGGVVPATFCVGIREFWHAEVLFENENAIYNETKSQPTQQQLLDFVSSEETPSNTALLEGAPCQVILNVHERNPVARGRCIAHYGPTCVVCDFNFGAEYGPLAEGFIHIHHVKPLSEIGEEYVVDPVADLRPVCPNCHAVIHLGGDCRSIEEVRGALEEWGRRRPRNFL